MADRSSTTKSSNTCNTWSSQSLGRKERLEKDVQAFPSQPYSRLSREMEPHRRVFPKRLELESVD